MNSNRIERPTGGFSLVELLAVIAIIGIMGAIIGLSLKPTEGKSLRSAQSAITGVFQAARTVATMRRTEARVLIYAGGSGVDQDTKFLRFMGVVFWDDPDGPMGDADGNNVDGKWIGANSGVYLPAGTFYIPYDSVGSMVNEGSSEVGTILTSEAAPMDQIAYPVSSGKKDDWYYYSFDGSGAARSELESSGDTKSFAGRSVIVASGRPGPPTDGTPTIIIDNELSTAGFVIRRIGGVLSLNDYSQIEDAAKN